MTAAPVDAPEEESTFVIRYDVSDAWIAEMKARCADLSFDTPAQYRESTKALQIVRETRTSVEHRRVDLKRPWLEFGRAVDAEAKRLTAGLLEIETPLKAKKDAVDAEKERARREAEELRLWAERELEEARKAEERKTAEAAAQLERERFAAERAKFEAEKAAEAEARKEAEAAAKLEKQKLDAERAAFEAEKRLLREAEERQKAIEAEKVARAKAEQEAKERAERERVAAEEARVREAERQTAEAVRLEAMKPDIGRVHAFGAEVRQLAERARAIPVSSHEAVGAIRFAIDGLSNVARVLEGFLSTEVAA